MQTSVSLEPTIAFPGMDGSGGVSDNISRVVSTLQLETITIAGNTNGTFSITIDGVEEASYEATSVSAAVISAALLLDMQNSTNSFNAEASTSTVFLIESTDQYDTDGFVCAVNSTGTSSDITTATTQAQGQTLQAGLGVCTDNRASVSGLQCRLPRLSADITARFLGITRADTAREASSAAIYGQHAPVSIKHRGRIWVRVEDAVTEMGAVYCRYTDAHTGYGLGSFRSDADTSDAALVPHAIYLTAAAAGGLALVELT